MISFKGSPEVASDEYAKRPPLTCQLRGREAATEGRHPRDFWRQFVYMSTFGVFLNRLECAVLVHICKYIYTHIQIDMYIDVYVHISTCDICKEMFTHILYIIHISCIYPFPMYLQINFKCVCVCICMY